MPILLAEVSFTGICASIASLRRIFSKNAARRLNPPYAVIFLRVNEILTLLISIFVVHFDCIFLFSFRLEFIFSMLLILIRKENFFYMLREGNCIFRVKKLFTTNSSPSSTECLSCTKKSSLPPSAEREKIEREIAITDEKIDKIV